jgi:hypothetical protein
LLWEPGNEDHLNLALASMEYHTADQYLKKAQEYAYFHQTVLRLLDPSLFLAEKDFIRSKKVLQFVESYVA